MEMTQLPISVYWVDYGGEIVTCYLVLSMKCDDCTAQKECELETMKATGIHEKKMKLMEVARDALVTDEVICAATGISNESFYQTLIKAAVDYTKRLFESMGVSTADNMVAKKQSGEALEELRKFMDDSVPYEDA